MVAHMIKSFVCVCTGDKYPPSYVNTLYNMVQRNSTDVRFHVITDSNKSGFNPEIKQIVVAPLYKSWWNKVHMFRNDIGLEGTVIFMDLDVVITGNIDCFYTHEAQLDFCGMNDFNPVSGVWNSSIMRFKQQDLHGRIWHKFMDDRPGYLRKFPGDQNLISDFLLNTPGTSSFPDSWTQSYKWYDRSGTRFSKQTWTYEHNGESLVTVFHGQPNPHESDMEWIKNAWK